MDIDQRLLSREKSLSAPLYTDVLRRERHYISDTDFDAIGGYSYDMDPTLSCELKRRAQERARYELTIDLLEVCGTLIV